MKKLILIFVFAVSLICCDGSSTNSSNSGETRIDLITGINVQSSIDAEPIQLGNPNINSDNTVQVFPNPSSLIYVLAQNPISDVWLLPCDAQKIYQDVDLEPYWMLNYIPTMRLIPYQCLNYQIKIPQRYC